MEVHVVGPYQFVKFITAGTSGYVWECRHCQTGEPVACKAVPLENILCDEFWQHFKNELIIHSRIRHSSIAQLKDVLLDSTYIYVMIEMCDGGDLNTYVESNGPLPEDQARHFFWRIMESILYIHNLGVAHRDIKLENILITRSGNVKLTDFGLCKQQDEGGKSLTACGTLIYAAPEVIKQEPYDGMKADVWSAGIVLYAMIANHLPWVMDNSLPQDSLWAETVRQITEGDIQTPPGSWEVRDLIESMLTVDPDERPSAADVLQHPWMEGCADMGDGQSTDPDEQLVQRVQSIITELEAKRTEYLRSQGM